MGIEGDANSSACFISRVRPKYRAGVAVGFYLPYRHRGSFLWRKRTLAAGD